MSIEHSTNQDIVHLAQLKSDQIGAQRPIFSSEVAGPEFLAAIREYVDFTLYFGRHTHLDSDRRDALSFVRSLDPDTTILLVEQYGYDPFRWDGAQLVLPSEGLNAFEEAALAAWKAGMHVQPADFDSWDVAHWETYQKFAGAEHAPNVAEILSGFVNFWEYPFEDAVAACVTMEEMATLDMHFTQRQAPIYRLGLHTKARSHAAVNDMLLTAGHILYSVSTGHARQQRYTIALMRGRAHMTHITEYLHDLRVPYRPVISSTGHTYTNQETFFSDLLLQSSNLPDTIMSNLTVLDMRTIYELYRQEFVRRIPTGWNALRTEDKSRVNHLIAEQLRSYLDELTTHFADQHSSA